MQTEGRRSGMHVRRQARRLENVRELLRTGALVNARDKDGTSALMNMSNIGCIDALSIEGVEALRPRQRGREAALAPRPYQFTDT
eukprot:scaffold154303_cov40-Tisochrysis_lutea.AAC.1